MKRFWSCFEYDGISGINPQVFLPQHGNEALFVFSTFQTLDYSIFKNIIANPCRFIRDNKKRTAKQIQPNGRGNDLNIASFLVFLKMLLFQI